MSSNRFKAIKKHITLHMPYYNTQYAIRNTQYAIRNTQYAKDHKKILLYVVWLSKHVSRQYQVQVAKLMPQIVLLKRFCISDLKMRRPRERFKHGEVGGTRFVQAG